MVFIGFVFPVWDVMKQIMESESMDRSLRGFFAVSVLVWTVVVLWVCGGVMRESDQASLLDGARILAQGATGETNFHNYSGQFGSYWGLAWIQQFFTFDSLKDYVEWGNRVACWSFVGLVLAGMVVWGGRLRAGLVHFIFISLTTPCVLLSVPFLSSNVLAGAAILALLLTTRYWHTWLGCVLGSGLVFIAVCLRLDAAFLLPLICFVPQRELRVSILLKTPYFWCFLGASIGALLLGMRLCPDRYFPELVFDWKLIGCYTVFGLLGSGLILLWGARLACRSGQGWLTKMVLLFALFLPVAAYLFVLYSPRHFFMAGLIPLILALSYWVQVGAPTMGRKWGLLSVGALFVNLIWLVISPQIQKEGGLRLDVKNATCYPTADGLWPSGGGAHFLYRLAYADQERRAVDHNQEVWGAWEDWVPQQDLSSYAFSSQSSLRAYSFLWLHYYSSQPVDSDLIKTEVRVETDREWIGVGGRDTQCLEAEALTQSSFFSEENLSFSSRGRLLFMDSPLLKQEVDRSIFRKRFLLDKRFPQVEFLSAQAKNSEDGHLYVEGGGEVFKSNLPEIFSRFF